MKAALIEQLEFMVAGGDVKRYHTIRTLQEETVGHHSHAVAVLCYLLTNGTPSNQLLLSALFHDLAEHQLGDIPSPAKREYGIGEQVNALEEKLLTSIGFVSALNRQDARTLKIADIFQGMLFCKREVELGNKKMQTVLDRYKSYAESMILVGIEKDLYNAIQEI